MGDSPDDFPDGNGHSIAADMSQPSRATAPTRVKICGIRDVATAKFASAQGADVIGLNFVERSPRFIDVEQARRIADALDPGTQLVGLFMNHTTEQVEAICDLVPLNALQFHGDESLEFCQQFKRCFWRAIALGGNNPRDVAAGEDSDMSSRLARGVARFEDARALLVDAHAPGAMGGSGQVLDWHALAAASADSPWRHKLVLAGGLNPRNVAAAVALVRPAMVDVSSGVESSRGTKSHDLIARFVAAVRQVDAELTISNVTRESS